MNRDLAQQYRDIGTRLALYLRQRQDDWPSSAALQGIVADLLATHVALALPLKDLVSRPAFRTLLRKAGSGSGGLERDALLQDLQRTFAAEVVNDLAEVLNGILDLPLGSGHVAVRSAALEPPAHQATLTADRDLIQRDAPHAPSAPRSTGRLLVVSLSTAALAAAVVVALRTPPLCALLNLCAASSTRAPSDAALQAAAAAEQALRRASTIDAYATALDQLERELLKLSGDPLSTAQQQQRDALQAAARDARRNLEAEQADQQQLALAQQAFAQASSSSGTAQEAQITAARQALVAIPPGSFAAAEASRLRSALEQLVRQPESKPTTDQPAPDPATDSGSNEAIAPPVAPPSPRDQPAF